MTDARSQPSTIAARLRALVILDEVRSDNPLGRDAADYIERLTERCEAYKGQVESGAAEIERLRAALRAVMDASNDPYMVARAALNGVARTAGKP